MILGISELFAVHLCVCGRAVALQPRQQQHVAHAELLPDGLLRPARFDQPDGLSANRNCIVGILAPAWSLLGCSLHQLGNV